MNKILPPGPIFSIGINFVQDGEVETFLKCRVHGGPKSEKLRRHGSHAELAATGAPLGVSRLSVAASYPYAGLCGVPELCL